MVNGQVGHVVRTFFDLFSSNHGAFRRADESVGSGKRNIVLAKLLRYSVGAKIRFLDAILGLYLALNCQTYFDVVAHVVLTVAYTLPSLFSTTGLYFHGNKKVTGSQMLIDAVRKVAQTGANALWKDEIHTSDGLVIIHLKQVRIRVSRARQNDDDRFSFQSIQI